MTRISKGLGATLAVVIALIGFAPFAAEAIILIALDFGSTPLLHP